MTFAELLAALLLLVAVIGGVGQCMVTVGRATRETQRYERAIELANIALERAAAGGPSSQQWDDQQITGIAYTIDLAVEQRSLESPENRSIQPMDSDRPPTQAVQVSATVLWENSRGHTREVTLHAWRFTDDATNGGAGT